MIPSAAGLLAWSPKGRCFRTNVAVPAHVPSLGAPRPCSRRAARRSVADTRVILSRKLAATNAAVPAYVPSLGAPRP